MRAVTILAAPMWVLGLGMTLVAFDSSADSAGTSRGLLERSKAAYNALASYADTGAVIKESPGFVDRFKFMTRYRKKSLDFYFDYQGVSSQNPKTPELKIDLSSNRLVLWMMKGDLQKFSQTLGSHETYPREGGNQTGALQNASAGTYGAAVLIPSLLFSKSDLPGTLRQVEQVSEAGFENVGSRRCHKLIGIAAQYYPSGARTNVRPVTIWLDAENLLVRKVFEDTPKGYPIGSFSRITVTIEPQANPMLDDSKFQFTVPSSQQ